MRSSSTWEGAAASTLTARPRVTQTAERSGAGALDDVPLEIDDLPLSDLEEVEAALLAAVAETSFVVDSKRQDVTGGWQNLVH